MSDDNVTIGNVTVSIDNLETAIDELASESGNIQNEYTVVGDVAIVGDSYSDGDFTLVNTEDVVAIDGTSVDAPNNAQVFTSVRSAEDHIADAQNEPFVDYVKSIEGLGSANDVTEDNSGSIGYGDAFVEYDSHLSKGEMRALVDDDGVRIGAVEADGDTVSVGVYDVRSE